MKQIQCNPEPSSQFERNLETKTHLVTFFELSNCKIIVSNRSSIGPARESGDVSDERHAPPPSKKKTGDDEEEEEDLNDSNYDEEFGYGGSIFKNDPFEKDD